MRAKAKSKEQSEAEQAATKYRELAEKTELLGRLEERMALVQGFLTTGTWPEGAEIKVLFYDGTEYRLHSMYGSPREHWTLLVSEQMASARAILVATEISLRDQIRTTRESLEALNQKD